MSEEKPGVSRRQVLIAAAGAGGLGAAAGVGTGALLGDTEAMEGLFQSGSLDLEVVWSTPTSNATVDGNEATLTADIDPGARSGSVLLKLSLPDTQDNNPANVWFRPKCPDPAGTDLAEALEVDVYHSDDGGSKDSRIDGGILIDWTNRLRDERGVGLDLGPEGCLQPGEDAYLLFEWTLPDSYDAGETVDVDFVFRARQCRNDDGTESPFTSLPPCADPCPCCRLIGKYELDDDGKDSHVDPGQYAFSEGSGDYELVVDETTDKDDGEETVAVSIDVVGVGGTPDPELCEVVLKAATGKGSSAQESYTGQDVEPEDDGNTPMLESVPRTEDPSEPGDYYGISSITVGICTDENEGDECPCDLVAPTGPPECDQ